MQRIKFYTIDLTKIKGNEKVRCPQCKIEISPDDKTENNYKILKPVMRENSLERIILKCNKCGSQIHLTGFQILNRLE